jgi:hypothetical protein
MAMVLFRLILFVMLFWFGPALAAETAPTARLDRLPELWVLTRDVEGEYDEVQDMLEETLTEVEEVAKRRGIRLTAQRIVIYEVAGLKQAEVKMGYVIEGDGRGANAARGDDRNFDLHRLPRARAYVASGVGSERKVIPVRGAALRAAEKSAAKRYKRMESLEIYTGNPLADEVKVDVYVPLAR